jgi:hypothetical protein
MDEKEISDDGDGIDEKDHSDVIRVHDDPLTNTYKLRQRSPDVSNLTSD